MGQTQSSRCGIIRYHWIDIWTSLGCELWHVLCIQGAHWYWHWNDSTRCRASSCRAVASKGESGHYQSFQHIDLHRKVKMTSAFNLWTLNTDTLQHHRCLGFLWNVYDSKQLGMENSLHSPDCLLLLPTVLYLSLP